MDRLATPQMNARKIKRLAVDSIVWMVLFMGWAIYVLPVLTDYFKPSIVPVLLVGTLMLWTLQIAKNRAMDHYFGKRR